MKKFNTIFTKINSHFIASVIADNPILRWQRRSLHMWKKIDIWHHRPTPTLTPISLYAGYSHFKSNFNLLPSFRYSIALCCERVSVAKHQVSAFYHNSIHKIYFRHHKIVNVNILRTIWMWRREKFLRRIGHSMVNLYNRFWGTTALGCRNVTLK